MLRPRADAATAPSGAPPLDDHARLHAMFDAHHNLLWRTLRRYGLDAEAAADVAQQAYVVAVERISDIWPGSERAFLIGTALRLARRAHRRAARVLIDDRLDEQLQKAGQPEAHAATLELLDLLLSQLDADLIEVFVLFDVEGFSTPEIAEALAIPVGTVASRLRRAREEFRALTKRLSRVFERGRRPMNEPEAWPELERTELEQRLLDAAKSDRIPNDSALRMAAALAPASVAPPPMTTSTSTLGHGGLLFSKTGLWGFLSLALLGGSGALYATLSAPHAGAATRNAPQPAFAAPMVAASAVPSPTNLAAPEPATVIEAQAPSQSSAPRNAGPAAARDAAGALRQEIALLDRAREALQQGAPQRAWTLLDQHQQRFAHGTLVPEAEAMRIETLVRLGATERAQRMSRAFLAAYPTHPLRERVSTLTRPLPEPHAAP